MQLVAREMNLAETAFLHRIDGGWNLRWFTPTVEVDLCGHATLAGAHVLWTCGHLPENETARFLSRSGWLTADRRGDWIELDFPATPPSQEAAPANLLEALGVSARFVGRTRFDCFVEVATAAEVRALSPDFSRLKSVKTRGVIVTSPSDSPAYDFVSRFFAPASGIDEDPVTGSAHCALAPYWAGKLGRRELTGWQASERGGLVRVVDDGDRTKLLGKAVTVLRGELLV
jgi:PhzF family phenazine biosynthesis protein